MRSREKKGMKIGTRIKETSVSIYMTVRMLIRLRRTAASTEVVNISGVLRVMRLRLLVMKL